ncbi:conjugal transfer protein TraR, partial [Candidatus Shapirobacteria bacterium]|nr:conjugal transfer protein TraR [Candidatus Shapirobacteria bacterium]
ALEGQINRKLIQIKKALSRLKIGKYGVCEKCGKMIDTDRLMIMPETTVCVKCEKKKEK